MNNELPACSRDWDARYRQGDAPWDLGGAPPCLDRAIAAEVAAPKEGEARRVIVPGAGRGHDARAWARAGFDATALDIAPTAVAEGQAIDSAEGLRMAWLEGDLFDLPEEMNGAFDLVWEQTCFCAILPEERDAYVAAVARLLKPGGRVLGVLWDVGRAGGPPHAITRADVERHFVPTFEIVVMEDVPVWTERRWDEFTVELRLPETPIP